eukprot:208579_1
MGQACCPGAQDKSKHQRDIMLRRESTMNDAVERKEREITIHNQSDTVLWVIVAGSRLKRRTSKKSQSLSQSNAYSAELGAGASGVKGNLQLSHSNSLSDRGATEDHLEFDNIDNDTPGANKVGIYSKANFCGFGSTFITAWYYITPEYKQDDNNDAPKIKETVWNNRGISYNEDKFVFDGEDLFCKDVSTKTNIVDGKYYVLPAVYKKNRCLMVQNDGIVITKIMHAPSQQFVLQSVDPDARYCNVISESSDLFWNIDTDMTDMLTASRQDRSLNQQFAFERIQGSDTIRIRSRPHGSYLTVKVDNITIAEWNQKDPDQRFIVQPA